MKILKPNWPQPSNIIAFTTLKGYKLTDVNIDLPNNLIWLSQEHGKKICNIDHLNCINQDPIIADGSYTQQKNIACIIKTADCLPILITNLKGTFVGALHAGWKGLAKGILYQFFSQIKTLDFNLNELLFWLGPSIGENNFEIGEEVVAQFAYDKYRSAFKQIKQDPNKYLANLYKLATINLNLSGINNQQIFSHFYCTFSDPRKFYSYRREPVIKDRMYSCIWITA